MKPSPSKQLRTIGDKLYEMDDEDKSVVVKQDRKIYKKSLEHYYFKNKSHPSKKAMEVIASRGKYLDRISPSSSRIIKKQIQDQNWSSKKPADVGVLSASIVASSNFPNSVCSPHGSDYSRFDLASSILDSSNRKSSGKHITLLG